MSVLTAGLLLAERYRLRRRIAVGGMGEVWEAADERLDRRVAVKVLKAELSGDTEFLHRFRAEARTTASLNHPGVAAVHDYGETAAVPDGPADTAYLVMELVEGEPLAALLHRTRRLPADRTLDVLEQAGHALHAAHERGLVHRDVKPGNILITPTGLVKITDFGIAKAVDAAPVTRSGMVMGTAHYIAPEQAMGQEAGPASDVYSLGVVGYECLTGKRPFLSDNAVTVAMMHIRDVPPPLPLEVPHGVRALIEATLVKDPRSRYGTGGEFAKAVGAVRVGLPLPPPLGLSAPRPAAGPVLPPIVVKPAAHAQRPSTPPSVHSLPVHSQPGPSQPLPSQPAQSQPGHSQPGHSQPAHSQPHSQPAHSQPVTGTGAGRSGPVPVSSLDTAPTPTGPFPPPLMPTPPPPTPARRPVRQPQQRLGVWVFVILLLLAALLVGGWVVTRAVTRAADWSPQNVTSVYGTNAPSRPPETGTVRADRPADHLVEPAIVEEER